MGKFVVTTIVAALLLAGTPLWAENLLTNGDFEDTTGWGDPGTTENPVGWPSTQSARKNPAAKQSGADAIGGAGTSAYMPAFYTSTATARRDFGQYVEGSHMSAFVLAFDLASEDPGGAEERSYNSSFVMIDSLGQMGINMRVVDDEDNGVGDLQIYSGSAWVLLSELRGCITFDDNVTTTPQVNHVALTGRFDSDNAYYDLVVTNASDQVFAATGIQIYAGTRLLNAGAELKSIAFSTFASYGDYLLDNVSITEVPEPSTIAMLLLGGLCALAIKLRRR